MTDNISTLKDWSQNGKLSEVTFNENGTFQLGDANIRAVDSVEVTANEKSCQYTAGSIFLQLVDPNQSLLNYRKACKKHQVKDPVKAGDKPVILAFFLGSSTSSTTTTTTTAAPSESAAAAAATSTTTSTTKTSTIPAGEASETVNREQKRDRDRDHDEKKKSRSSSDKDKNRSSSSSTKKRERSRSSSRPPSSSKEKKTKTKTIDPEKLFSNLSLVVGRREIRAKRDAEQAKLHLALSTEGFETVAPEIIAKYNNQESMAHEIPVGNSSSILKAGAGKDLSRVLKLYNETITGKNNSYGAGKNKTGSAGKGGPSSDGSKKSWRPYLVGKKPIIILPKGMQAPVTLVNAHKFFAESKFVTREKMQKELRTIKQAPKTVFTRNVSPRLGGGAVEYELMDNPKSKLNAPEDWERVVSVVALGQSWQMKDWPGSYSNPVQLFNRAFGFYIGMQGDKIPMELQSWSVTQSSINRDKRGLDSVAYSSFWNALDEWMAIYKPEMLPQPNE